MNSVSFELVASSSVKERVRVADFEDRVLDAGIADLGGLDPGGRVVGRSTGVVDEAVGEIAGGLANHADTGAAQVEAAVQVLRRGALGLRVVVHVVTTSAWMRPVSAAEYWPSALLNRESVGSALHHLRRRWSFRRFGYGGCLLRLKLLQPVRYQFQLLFSDSQSAPAAP